MTVASVSADQLYLLQYNSSALLLKEPVPDRVDCESGTFGRRNHSTNLHLERHTDLPIGPSKNINSYPPDIDLTLLYTAVSKALSKSNVAQPSKSSMVTHTSSTSTIEQDRHSPGGNTMMGNYDRVSIADSHKPKLDLRHRNGEIQTTHHCTSETYLATGTNLHDPYHAGASGKVDTCHHRGSLNRATTPPLQSSFVHAITTNTMVAGGGGGGSVVSINVTNNNNTRSRSSPSQAIVRRKICRERLEEEAQKDQLSRTYRMATWAMYCRIIAYRAKHPLPEDYNPTNEGSLSMVDDDAGVTEKQPLTANSTLLSMAHASHHPSSLLHPPCQPISNRMALHLAATISTTASVQ